jgi:CII-binding regulator of phage lambda lysogenization HflD
MADNFGLKIGVEGEKEFKKALSDINQSFKVLGSEMKLVESEFGKNENSVQSLTSKNEVLTKQIDAQKDKIETLRKALENASDSFGENDRRTQQWAVQLNNAQAELNGMERELKDNEKALDNVADNFDDAEKQADQFGDELEKTGKEADSSGSKFEKLGSVVKGIGAAMGAAFVAVGAAAISAGKALVDMTVEAAAYADEMLTQSTVTGMSVRVCRHIVMPQTSWMFLWIRLQARWPRTLNRCRARRTAPQNMPTRTRGLACRLPMPMAIFATARTFSSFLLCLYYRKGNMELAQRTGTHLSPSFVHLLVLLFSFESSVLISFKLFSISGSSVKPLPHL